MKIRHIKISNFRGIRNLAWNVPSGENILCLIGKGDSAKTTILDAIRFAFYPNWNLSLKDTDFHLCDTENPIQIDVHLGELSGELCSISKYGLYLRGWDSSGYTLEDEPNDALEKVLTVQFSVNKFLEPSWHVICDRQPEGIVFKQSDRIKVNARLIGTYADKQLTWAKDSALSKITSAEKPTESLVNTARSAQNAFDTNRGEDLDAINDVARKCETMATSLGVPVVDGYKVQLDQNSINIGVGGLSLHDGNIPMRLLGLGSRRMLLCGIQKLSLEEEHITLMDEVEFGLEPNRIARLVRHIKDDKRGQYFLTTHSPIVLRELSATDLHIVHNNHSAIQIVSTADGGIEELGVQGKIRSSAEAFLAKKVVICEGATEVGFLRGFDDYQLARGKFPFSYLGVALLDVNGASKIMSMAKAFKTLHYSVAVLADGDAPANFSKDDEVELNSLGISVHIWDDELSLEERAMRDLPWDYVMESVKLANQEFGCPVHDNVVSQFSRGLDIAYSNWGESSELRYAIGKAAKQSNWFKAIAKGQSWFSVIAPSFDDPEFIKKDLAVKMRGLWAWAENE